MLLVRKISYRVVKMNLRESVLRKGVRADTRLPFEELFFDDGFDAPLSREKAGALAEALELVRLGPSAVNRQPWRIVVCGDDAHFYEKKRKGFVDAGGWDIQKIDMGIALCHFALWAEEAGRTAEFRMEDPGLVHPEDTEYIASYRLG